MSAELDALKRRQQKAWSAGDFSRVGVASPIVGELLCEAVRLQAGERVLDIATGAGSTAISAARRATEVTGVDFVPALLARGRERAAAEGVRVQFLEGDTEALPFPDASFDVVLSTFGHMFAPDQVQAASEMTRVCRPGGRVGFTAWTPQGFTGNMFRINGKYAGSSPAPPPVLWGEEMVVRERFAARAKEFRFERRYLTFRAHTPEEWMAHMRQFFGPTRTLWESLDEGAREALTADTTALIGTFNRSTNGTMLVDAEYLETVIELR